MLGLDAFSGDALGSSSTLPITSATYGTATYDESQYGVVFVAGSAGSYTLTGGDATFQHTYSLTADAGSYSITGQNAQTTATRLVNGDAGAYSITGGAATLIHNDVIYAGYWQFAITGYDAGLSATRLLSAESGAYTLTGSDAELAVGHILSADAGSYAYTGQDASLTYTPAITEIVTTGGIDKRVKTKIKKSQREEVEAAVREAFDKMDGTYVPPEVVSEVQKEVKREIKKIDLGEYEYAMAQINALLFAAKLKIHEYESEIDDEESLLMLL